LASTGKEAGVFLLLVLLGSLNLYAILDPSMDKFTASPPLDKKVYDKLWGFDWSSGLDLRVEEAGKVEYKGATVDVVHLTFALFPWDPSCRIHAWLYSMGDRGPAWIILIHGLGGTHKFFEEPLNGYKVSFDLALMGFNVLAIDAAGHGESCIPEGKSWEDKATTIEPGEFFLYYVYVSGVRAVEAAKALGAEPGRIAVMGVSMGGMTSYVVASIHPDVSLAIPIVASGCIPCMIQSGGLANLVGPAGMKVNGEVVERLAAADPLSYIKLAAREGWLEGKTFYILFSGHDEYFPTEGLKLTVEALKEGGARVSVAFAGNNNHYKPAPRWMDSAFIVLRVFLERGVDGVASMLPDGQALDTDEAALVAGASEWRPGADGLAYLPGIPLAPMLLGGEVVGKVGDRPLANLLPWSAPLILKIAVLAIFTVAAALYAERRGIPRWPLAIVAAYASAVAFASPFWLWPGRFHHSVLSLMERYAVTPSMALGIPTNPLLTLAVTLSPVLAAALAVSTRRASSAVAAVLYLVFSLLPFLLMRAVLGIIESRAPQPLPARIVPVEAVYIAVLAGMVLARRKMSPGRGELKSWVAES
jgi:fermentation-respiration switch protein FrsA (DUF1100 family)